MSSDPSHVLVSNAERDAAAQRLQVAFAEQRLTDDEFDQRIRAALTARTAGELDRLTADLPAAVAATGTAATSKPGKFAVAYKSTITRSGRWSVARRLLFCVYKGSGHLDLRAAELTAPVTIIRAIAYKSRTEIVLPPGVRVELGGLGVSSGGPDDHWPDALPAEAPVVRIKGLGYKGSILVTTRPARGELVQS
jgi:Domain of unknown function (DUF1707)